MATPRDLMSIPDAARAARISVITLRRWIARGLVTQYGRPGCFRVSLSEVAPPAPSRRSKVYYTPDGKAPAFRSPKAQVKRSAA